MALALFGHLLSQIYLHNSVDCFFICGDMNSKTGNMIDYGEGVGHSSPPPVFLDPMSKNKHGECLIDFLIECKRCIVNGRVTPSVDNYTSVSTIGNVVVDYFAVPQDCLPNCVKCDI